MKTKIARRIARMFTRKTYLATVLLAGSIVKIPVTAPDHRRAMEEIESVIDDCGFLLDFPRRENFQHNALDKRIYFCIYYD